MNSPTPNDLPSGEVSSRQPTESCCKLIDWFHEGQARTVTVGEVEITIRLIARKGRRGRIAIVAPPGAIFRSTSE